MIKHLLFSALLILSLSAYTQNGCTDPKAINYNPEAHINDGSCEYDPLILVPEVKIERLSPEIGETSGLIWFANGLWTHNDSGGEAAIYKMNVETGDIIQTVFIRNGENFDIEDITQDNEFIYVGDFGNNYGTREDLKIYKISKNHINDSSKVFVNAELITFKYKDQQSFISSNRNNNFDCEALICRGDYLYLFTKNWINQETKCYKLPKETGDYELDVHERFNVRGLITGADFNEHHQTLILVGYENFIPFTWVIWDFDEDLFFSGNKKRVDFAYIQGAQTEGICFKNSQYIFMSCEASFYEPRLFTFNTNQIINATGIQTDKFTPFDISLQVNPVEDLLYVNIFGLNQPDFGIELYNLSWQKVHQVSFRENNFQKEVQVKLSISNIQDGLYFLRIKQGNKIGFKKLFIQR